MKKRLIAFLLVLIMVLGMLPVSALAADGDATRYTYHLIHEFNYVGGTRWDIQATTAAESYQLDVNKGKPTRNGYTFLGWADKADATVVQYHGGDLILLTKDKPTKTIYAVWEKNVAPIEYTVTYYKNDGSANDVFYKTPTGEDRLSNLIIIGENPPETAMTSLAGPKQETRQKRSTRAAEQAESSRGSSSTAPRCCTPSGRKRASNPRLPAARATARIS